MSDYIKKIKYFLGNYYRGLIGIFHNYFDKLEKIDKNIEHFSIGNSINGKEINCYKIGNGKNNLLIFSAIHGNEVGTAKLSHKILNWMWNNKTDFNNLTLYVIPVLNPDGYLKAVQNPNYFNRGRVGRFNSNNVDLNRNFPSSNFSQYDEWGMGKDFKQKQKVFCGEFGASEPEVENLVNFIKDKNIKNIIALHNVGQDVIISNDKNKQVNQWTQIYNKQNFKTRFDLGYSGGAMDWAQENNLNYMAVEGTSRWGSDWKKQKLAIIQVLKEINNQK